MPTFLTATQMAEKIAAVEKLGARVSDVSIQRRANLSVLMEHEKGEGFELTPDEEVKKNGDVPALSSIVQAYRKLVDSDETFKGKIAVKPDKPRGVVLVSRVK